MKDTLSRGFLKAAILLPILSIGGFGAVIQFDVSTNTGQWNVVNFSGASINTRAYVPSGTSDVSVTSNAYSPTTGSTVVDTGHAFNGFWIAQVSFLLPSGAFNAVLNFNDLYGDDRALLQLNGTTIGNTTVHHDVNVWGKMTTTSGTSDYYFTNVISGSVALSPGLNTLQLIVNNTGTAIPTDPTRSWQTLTDASMANMFGTVSYETASGVPEPGSMALLLIGLLPIAYGFRKSRRCR